MPDTEPPEGTIEQSHGSISPNGDNDHDNLRMEIEFSEETEWSLTIAGEGTPAHALTVAAGMKVFEETGVGTSARAKWDGTSNGEPVAEGRYIWILIGRDTAGNRMQPVVGEVIVDRTAPVILGLNASDTHLKLAKKEKTKIKFDSTEKGLMRVEILNPKKQVVRVLGAVKIAGRSISVTWNGKNKKGKWVHEGKYLVQAVAEDEAGNTTLLRSLSVFCKR